MHREGHIGAALLCYMPVGFITALIATFEVAVLGAVLAAGLAMVPDLDMRVPFVKHRGITHTVHFAVGVGIVLGLCGVMLGAEANILVAVGLGLFGFSIGSTTVLSHIAADALTPAGVDPFRRDEVVSYDVARARNPIANYGLLLLGGTACVVAAMIAGLLGA